MSVSFTSLLFDPCYPEQNGKSPCQRCCISPALFQLVPDHIHRITAIFLFEVLYSGPGANVPYQMVERPFKIIVENGGIYFLERERDCPVILIDIFSFFVPIRTDDITIKTGDDPVYGRIDLDKPIADDGEHSPV